MNEHPLPQSPPPTPTPRTWNLNCVLGKGMAEVKPCRCQAAGQPAPVLACDPARPATHILNTRQM